MAARTEPMSAEWFKPMDHADAVKGYVVGHGPRQVRGDGTSWSRPKLLEVEATNREAAVAIGAEIVWLDRETTERARDLFNDALEAMS